MRILPAAALAVVLMPVLATAQEPPLRPAAAQELWMSVGVRGRAPGFLKDLLGDHYGRLRLSGEVGYRSADNFFAGRQVYTDLGARYRATKWLAFGFEYRYASRVGAADRQRITPNLVLSRSFGRWDVDYRFIFQRVFLDRDRQRTILRNRFSVAYDIKRWKLDPEFSVEFFTRTDQPQRGWYRLGTRYKLGTSWSPWKGHSFGPSVIYDRDGRVAWPVNRVIWSVDYVLNLRRL